MYLNPIEPKREAQRHAPCTCLVRVRFRRQSAQKQNSVTELQRKEIELEREREMGKKAKSSKQAWRANISTADIADFFEKSTKDALSGGSLTSS